MAAPFLVWLGPQLGTLPGLIDVVLVHVGGGRHMSGLSTPVALSRRGSPLGTYAELVDRNLLRGVPSQVRASQAPNRPDAAYAKASPPVRCS